MSAINGDKSRHQINRKRGVLRRMKIRQLMAAKNQTGGATAAPESGARRPSRGRSR